MTILNGMIVKHFEEPVGSNKAWCTGDDIPEYPEPIRETMDNLMCQICLSMARGIGTSIQFMRIYHVLRAHEPRLPPYDSHPSIEGCEGCTWEVSYPSDITPWDQYLQHLRM